ncbi:MAG TPA: STAS domain-containing protein [Candidatus Limnocylindrales bacterium]|nr:STAS domain-containing protein [Candidatus Limnocylindrales bacterium]
MALETTIEQATGRVPITIIALDGELDASNFTDLIETARRLYDSGTRQLLLDLTNLRFMASSGLVALHSILRVMHGEAPPDPDAGWGALHSLGFDVSEGGTQTDVQLCAPQGPVERVLIRTGLSRLFLVHPDRASAIAAF